MKSMRRVLAMLLCVVMVVGLIPAAVFAADADTDYLFFATDRHTNTSIIATMINNMEKKIGENNLEYLGLGGDMVGSGNSHPSYNSSTVLGEVTGATTSLSAANVDIVAGIHDMNVTDDAGIVLPYSGGGAQIYEGDKYYVYGVPESCISGEVSGVDPETEANDFVTWANGSNIDKSKVIFVLSHYPLHQRRNDNDGAVYWAAALNKVAVGDDTTIDRDVAFFWGHNHTGESSADTAVYHVAPNGSISVQGGSSSQKIYFTYANAGYLNAKSSATLVEVTDTTITFNKYTNSSYTTNTVTRVVQEEEVTLESIAISGKTDYAVGDELALTVTATYSDGTTADVTADAELSGYNMAVGGAYTVTATYEGKTATYAIKVNPMTVTEWDDTAVISVTATANDLTGLTVTNVYGEPDLSTTFDDYMAVSVIPAGVAQDAQITYAIEVLAEIPVDGLVLYHVADDGTLTPINYTLSTSESGGNYLNFTSDLTGIFAYGIVTVPAGYVLDSLKVENSSKVDYFVGNTLNLTGLTVIATYTKEGAEDFTRILYIKDDYATTDGYTVSGYDMTKAGQQTVIVTYENCTDSFDIHVWGAEITNGEITVALDKEGSEYGIAGVNVTESNNANVADAIQYVITGDNYVAYDITLTYENGYSATEDVKTVTLPIPEGVTNPVVYYVSDSGTAVDMKAVNNGDGTVSFTTTHFSAYVVGEGVNIETESGNATTEGSSTTTTEEKTVYVKVDAPVSGEQYLIVSTGAAGTAGYILGGSSVTPVSGTLTVNGTDGTYTYIESTGTLWTASGSGSSWRFANGSNYLGYTQSSSGNDWTGYNYSYAVNTAASSTTWTLNNSQLYIYLQSSEAGRIYGEDASANYYLTGGSSWSMSQTAANVYFYKEVTATITTTTGTVGHTYSTVGTDIEDAVAISGQTVTLSSVLYDTPDGGTMTDITASSGLTPTYEVVTTKGNPAVISKIENGVATLSGVAGTAVVKVTYTFGDLVAWDEFTVSAANVADEDYTIDLTDGEPNFNSITQPLTIKNIQEGMQTSVWAVVKAGEHELGTLGDALTWTISDPTIASIDTNTGVITFTGEEGTVDVTVIYTCPGGRIIQDTVTFSVTKGSYTVPEDGTDDFPEYPEPGAIRFDKHATAVGNFSETGIVQVELSMTGVPYGNDTAIDVMVMLDMTGSMSDDGMEAAEEATKAFVAKIVKNDDGTYNKNRVAVYAFNSGSSSPYELVALTAITSDSALETANTAIDTASDKKKSGGTPFDEAAQQCQTVLTAAKTTNLPEEAATAADYNRKQFCVFMSDGGPTAYRATYDNTNGYLDISNSGSGTSAITTYLTGYSSSSSSSWSFTLPTEYYTDALKADGVTVYTVGLLLQNAPSNPSPYSSMTDSTYDSTTDSLTTIGSHYYFTSSILKQMASDETKYIDIFDVDNASKATAAFESIAQSILDAATDVSVTDKIAEDYTMVFDAPNTTVAGALPTDQELYIEVKEYLLNPVYGTDGTTIVDYTRGTSASLMKLYLGTSGTTYYAASDAEGTAYASPAFNQTAIGTKFYWTTSQNTTSGVSVVVDGTTYYFVATGASNTDEDFDSTVWYNMASGAHASGNIVTTDILDDEDGSKIGENATCQDLIIATPYFVYNASTKMLVWTAAKLSTSELALSYFLYLDESGGYSGAEDETDPGTYETNEYAHLNYTNFQKKECQQTFPVPQMTWNGAQVSYVFYLVNSAGQPVNRAGKVVPFSEAVYVTDVYTYSIVWNDLEQVASLEAKYLASEYVPDVYELYDSGAAYNIHVFEDENAQNLNNHFVIGSGLTTYTTYVFNTKSDATKYKNPGTYAASATYKCKEYVAGGAYEDENGTYNIVTKNDAKTVETGFDFSNTTVAFAVIWKPQLVEDTVVVDYGLDVVIDVITNDALAAGVVGVATTKPNANINSGTYDADEDALQTSVDLYIDANHDADGLSELKIGTATVANQNAIRVALDKTNGMQFSNPAVFYYEAGVNYYESDSKLVSTNMYSSVTVIPATTVYYEDSYVTFEVYDNTTKAQHDGSVRNWADEGTAKGTVQDVDRPGDILLNDSYDANNVYGYDSAYKTMTTYSMGTAKKLTVDSAYYGEAKFSFYGTGFDVISMTSNQTGTIVVQVADAAGTVVKSKIVDTYYGYTLQDGKWVTSDNDPNAIYQVPVITVEGLTYGKYTVTITAAYNKFFAHNGASSYDFYLDAIRVYNPAGTEYGTDDSTDGVTGNLIHSNIQSAYKTDGEAWPSYTELRNNVIAASNYTVTESDDGTVTVTGNPINGTVFIDSIDETAVIADYVSYGPNNELYLKAGQAIAFSLSKGSTVADIQIGLKVANGNTVTYTVNGDSKTINSATDMYYSIADYVGTDATTITIQNTSGGILSVTNIKITYTADPGTAATTGLLPMDGESVGYVLRSLRPSAQTPEEEVPEATEPETNAPETDDTVTGETTAPEAGDTVTGETTAPEAGDTVTGENTAPEAGDTTGDTNEEVAPEVDKPAEDEVVDDEAEDVVTTGQLGFWARLWNAIKNAFKQLLSWFGF